LPLRRRQRIDVDAARDHLVAEFSVDLPAGAALRVGHVPRDPLIERRVLRHRMSLVPGGIDRTHDRSASARDDPNKTGTCRWRFDAGQSRAR